MILSMDAYTYLRYYYIPKSFNIFLVYQIPDFWMILSMDTKYQVYIYRESST